MEDRWRRHLRFGLSRWLKSDLSSTGALFPYCLVFGLVVMVLFRNSLYHSPLSFQCHCRLELSSIGYFVIS
jgi:hypothetical protein